MSNRFPEIHLVRHGETEWSLSGKHTGRSDIPLTERGEISARDLAGRLSGHTFGAVWSSPSVRASTTCILAGFGAAMVTKQDLAEWDYGDYEGLTTPQILQQRPGWQLFRDGCPAGETASDVGARADRMIGDLRRAAVPIVIFSSAHFLRVLAARWLGLPAAYGTGFVLGTASISVLGYEHGLDEPVIRHWNQE